MTDHIIKADRKEVLRAAKQAGGIFNGSDWKFYCDFDDDELERFWAIAYQQGLEDAAKLVTVENKWYGGKWVSTLSPETAEAIAATIRAHKEGA